jgi:hypothetical protein
MTANTPWEVVLLVVCFLYYGIKWEYAFTIKHLREGRWYLYWYIFFIVVTLIVQSVYITQIDDSWPLYVVSWCIVRVKPNDTVLCGTAPHIGLPAICSA